MIVDGLAVEHSIGHRHRAYGVVGEVARRGEKLKVKVTGVIKLKS